ncbi:MULTISPECIES: hypothetical protein [Paenibacillus]|uniref:hypothetical protein n=1 Tax=Paenibacillus TaxID=44249 RepID=UPI000B85EC6F|nr:hypothetical protein [Paenibacillus amylolyticus]
MDFHREYYGIITSPSQDKYEYAFIRWLEYYYQTEVYDRRVCSGYDEKTQSAIPLSTAEYIDINRNAKRLMNKIVAELRNKEIDEDTWRAARNEVARYSHVKVEDLLTVLNPTVK